MSREKKPPRYALARKSINRHLYRHHFGATGSGELDERLEQHGELHALGSRFGVPPAHKHSRPTEGESEEDEAVRVLREGEEQDNEGDK